MEYQSGISSTTLVLNINQLKSSKRGVLSKSYTPTDETYKSAAPFIIGIFGS